MKVKQIHVELEESEDYVAAHILDRGVDISIVYNGAILVCNKQEERIYYLSETEHGGFELEEGSLE